MDELRLDEIGRKWGTDKSSLDHSYLKDYERHLAPLRDSPINLLELGVWRGASMRTWREYFPRACIVGVDNINRGIWDPPDVDIKICDQNDQPFLDELSEEYGGWDVIIDDASHLSSKTIRSFEILFRHVRRGGLYVIEDLQTSYDVENYGLHEASVNPDERPAGGMVNRWTAMQFCKRLADEVNRSLFPEQYWWRFEVGAVEFRPNICFITKAW